MGICTLNTLIAANSVEESYILPVFACCGTIPFFPSRSGYGGRSVAENAEKKTDIQHIINFLYFLKFRWLLRGIPRSFLSLSHDMQTGNIPVVLSLSCIVCRTDGFIAFSSRYRLPGQCQIDQLGHFCLVEPSLPNGLGCWSARAGRALPSGL